MNALLERADTLHPYFQPIVREAIKRCYERGLYVFIMQARRPAAYQACLYAQGRATVGVPYRVSGFTVETTLAFGKVTVRCQDATNIVPMRDWHRRVTNVVLDSWHVQGLAVDLGFRASRNGDDALNIELDQQRKWAVIERIYAPIAAVWKEVAPECRWGNDWDGDGIPVKDDPDERTVDMPHFEWHPGRSLEQVRRGELPPFPKQCPECDNFRPVFVERRIRVGDRGWTVHVCSDCSERELDIEVKCVGLKG